jgi:hypothetical protein
VPPQPPADFTKYTLLAGFERVEGVTGVTEVVIVQQDIMVNPGQTAQIIDITPYEDGTGIYSINTLTVGVFNADGTQARQLTYDRGSMFGSNTAVWVYRWITRELGGGYA